MDDPVTWSKSGTRALDRAGSKNYGENWLIICMMMLQKLQVIYNQELSAR
jgi:hypothetical protein